MKIDPTTNGLPPSNPYHIARAYGVRPAASVQQSAAIGGAAPARLDDPAHKLPSAAQALVAAMVPGGVEFRVDEAGAGGGGAGDDAQPAAAVLQMYKHPAEKNAAATAVQVGRRLDVSG